MLSLSKHLAEAVIEQRHYLALAEQNLNNNNTPSRGIRKSMIANRQLQFKSNARAADEFVSLNGGLVGAYSHAESAGDFSLQKISYEDDCAYFKEVLSLLGIISSIVEKPHVSTKREEVFARIEQAGQLSVDDFTRVCRDGSLWKRRGLKMVPEELYYFRNEDEICIYENRFIVLLINLISKEITELKRVYGERLPRIGENTTQLSAGEAGKALDFARNIEKRVSYLKNTDFYKIVGKEKPLKGRIAPTNILLKDLKYRACFKFYNGFLKYQSEGEEAEDMRSVIKIYILKALKKLGFDFSAGENANEYKAENQEFLLTFDFNQKGKVILETLQKACKKSALHILFTGGEQHIDEAAEFFASDEGKAFCSIEVLSVWSLKDGATGEVLSRSGETEEEMIYSWLSGKIRLVLADSSAYKKYCPACGVSGVYENDGVFSCPNCGTQYAFTRNAAGESAIWICKLRRGV